MSSSFSWLDTAMEFYGVSLHKLNSQFMILFQCMTVFLYCFTLLVPYKLSFVFVFLNWNLKDLIEARNLEHEKSYFWNGFAHVAAVGAATGTGAAGAAGVAPSNCSIIFCFSMNICLSKSRCFSRSSSFISPPPSEDGFDAMAAWT